MMGWTRYIRTVYERTTVIEGTIHLICGAWKMLRVAVLSAYWRHNFARCGKGLTIFPGTRIDFPKNISVGDNFRLNHGSSLKSDNPQAKVIIGNNVDIGTGVKMDCSGGIVISDFVVISDLATIHTHSHGLDPFCKPSYKQLVIGKRAWVGGGSIILPQVSSIGDNAVVGAGAIVTKDVPRGAIVAGNPAKIIRQRHAGRTS
jgi:acetyltransferase-like isoleucine patch superfamily enzyme